MKLLFLITILLLTACGPDAAKQDDVITTASGLQYTYLKKGTGHKIEKGSMVDTYLSLSVNDSVIWNTDESPDSVFRFLAGYDGVIDGFAEMAMLLREGDHVVATMPANIAYGERGAGSAIPPGATLVYNQFQVRKVEAPKPALSDVLFETLKTGTVADMAAKYQQIMNSADTTTHHVGRRQMYHLWKRLGDEGMHQKAVNCAAHFAEMTNDPRLFFFAISSLDSLDRGEATQWLADKLKTHPKVPAYQFKMRELQQGR